MDCLSYLRIKNMQIIYFFSRNIVASQVQFDDCVRSTLSCIYIHVIYMIRQIINPIYERIIMHVNVHRM